MAKKSVLVRMYNVGFGDCFLMEFPGEPSRPTRVLIDCGSIAAANGIPMEGVVDKLLADCTDSDGVSRIDVVVCTHRHADHVSGFANAQWKDVQIKEVWFPWTEDPDDVAARDIRETQSKLALALAALWGGQAASGSTTADQWRALAMNALSNDKAMTMLHEGIKSKPKHLFLTSDGTPIPVKSKALVGINAYVLGPSKSPDIIRDMNPPAGQTYLRQLSGAVSQTSALEPFEDDWQIEPSKYRGWDLPVSDSEQKAIRAASSSWDPAITVALEQAVNGTSLVLVFEVGDAVLFFPGDAQWGTWSAFLKSKKSTDLLLRSTFWKVGHHGSHNATPKEFLSNWAQPACCAMMSTKPGKWSTIPRQPLVDAIAARGIELGRSDGPPNAKYHNFSQWTAQVVETRVTI